MEGEVRLTDVLINVKLRSETGARQPFVSPQGGEGEVM